MKRGEIAVIALFAVAAMIGCTEKLSKGDKTMLVEENKALTERFAEAWAKGNLDAMDELLDPNFIFHASVLGLKPDLEGYKEFIKMHHTAFPDFQFTIDDVVAEGDKVARRVTWSGTHKGEYMGIAPTGKQVTVTVITIERIEGGKIAEQWGEADLLGLMQQLGAVPPR